MKLKKKYTEAIQEWNNKQGGDGKKERRRVLRKMRDDSVNKVRWI